MAYVLRIARCIACMAAPMLCRVAAPCSKISSIIATIGHTANPGNTRHDYIPPLNNQTLFRRDGYLCMYCAQRFPAR